MTVTPAGEKASLLRCVWRAVEEGHVGKAVLWGSQERQPGLVRLAVWKGKAAPLGGFSGQRPHISSEGASAGKKA